MNRRKFLQSAFALMAMSLLKNSTGAILRNSTGGLLKSDSITFGVIPDMQKLARVGNEAIYANYMTWLVNNYAALGIRAFVNVGDTVDDPTIAQQWVNAAAAWDILDAANVPYLICAGNHDYDDDNVAARTITNYLAKYPYARFIAHDWWNGGVYEVGRPQNAYFIVSNYLFLSVEFGPRQVIIDWANDVIDTHPNHKVLLFTHGYLHNDGTWFEAADLYSPTSLGGDHDGDEIWSELVSQHSNIILVQCGHDVFPVGGPCAVRRTDVGAGGVSVPQVLSNYQSLIEHSDYLRIVTVNSVAKTISQRSYCVSLGAYLDNDDNQFVISYG